VCCSVWACRYSQNQLDTQCVTKNYFKADFWECLPVRSSRACCYAWYTQCLYTHTHTHTHTLTLTHARTYTHTHIQTHTYTHTLSLSLFLCLALALALALALTLSLTLPFSAAMPYRADFCTCKMTSELTFVNTQWCTYLYIYVYISIHVCVCFCVYEMTWELIFVYIQWIHTSAQHSTARPDLKAAGCIYMRCRVLQRVAVCCSVCKMSVYQCAALDRKSSP